MEIQKSGLPTWASTKKQIKDRCTVEVPKSVVASLSASVGGVLQTSAPGQLPRDEKQVMNYKLRASAEQRMSIFPPGTSHDVAADDLLMIMQKAFTEDPSRKFGLSMLNRQLWYLLNTSSKTLLDFVQTHLNSLLSPLTRHLW